MSKCPGCNGSGYKSAAKEMGMMDAPTMMRPIGVWQCMDCHGSGKDPESYFQEMFDLMSAEKKEFIEEFKAALERNKV